MNVYLHNLSNYDAHFIVRELAVDGGDVSVLANTEEKYISFTKRFGHPGAGRHNSIRLRFVDSYRFMAKSLAGLVSILPPEKLHETRGAFPHPEDFNLVRRKGVFPYEYVTSLQRLEDTHELPPMQAFHNKLLKEDVNPSDYQHAQRVWRHFGCQTLGDYADLYLKTDVLLLVDVFESFRDTCIENYNLDPAHNLTLPSYTWDVMLLKTGVTLDTLQDPDQYLFFEKGIRGGLVQCSTRHAVANNKYCRATDDTVEESAEDSNIMYYDANNLYGWAMSQPLPTGEFEWLSPEEVTQLDIDNIPVDGDYGYVLEVDLEYPQDRDLQDRHRDLPFCPEVRRAPAGQLPYSTDVLHQHNAGRSKKLMATLLNKEAYVIHYRSLQQALRHGLRILHVHRVLRFRQSAWLKSYIDLNTELRKKAKNKFESDTPKLMNNAVYGMSLQNVRKHIDIRIATNAQRYMKTVAKSNFSDRVWYSEDLALLHMWKIRVVLEKPIYLGMCILDLSKWLMYDFHYEKMQPQYGIERLRLLYMDTDSFMYNIRSADIYKDMLEHADNFDTSEYPQDHICYDPKNSKVLGKFKDEGQGVTIKEFIGLMAKLYCIVFAGGNEGGSVVKKAKGVNRAVVKHGLTVADYRDCLFHRRVITTNNLRFQSRHHIMYTVEVTKRSLAPYDDKRYVLPEDSVSTLPWGHCDIPPAAPPLPPQLPPPPPPPPRPAHHQLQDQPPSPQALDDLVGAIEEMEAHHQPQDQPASALDDLVGAIEEMEATQDNQ